MSSATEWPERIEAGAGAKPAERAPALSRIVTWQGRVETWLAFLCALVVAFMMLITSGDVVMRYVFNSPITGTFELMEFSLVAVAFLSFAYVQQQRGHITVEFIAERVSPRWRASMDLVVLVIVFPIMLIMVWQTAEQALEAWRTGDVTMGLIKFPLAPAKATVPLGIALLSLRVFSQIVRRVVEIVGAENSG